MTATPSIVELKPRITVIGVGGGGSAVNNMTAQQLAGVDFVAANNDVPALSMVQLGDVTEGLGAGSIPQVGYASAEETLTEIMDHLTDSHMCFVTAGMADGTGTGAGPVIARQSPLVGQLPPPLNVRFAAEHVDSHGMLGAAVFAASGAALLDPACQVVASADDLIHCK